MSKKFFYKTKTFLFVTKVILFLFFLILMIDIFNTNLNLILFSHSFIIIKYNLC